MAPLESRAWLALLGMCPAYAVYFLLQGLAPPWLATTPEHLICFAATVGVHVLIFATGLVVLAGRERGQGLVADERDRAIDGRATRAAYHLLMAGTIVVGVVQASYQGGWKIVNGALLAIVLAETLRNLLIVQGYRGSPRLAQ